MTNTTTNVSKSPVAKNTKFRKALVHNLTCYAFLTPMIIGLLVFTAYPVFSSLVYSFSDYNGVLIRDWGFFNYQDIFDTSKFGLFQDVMKSFGLTFAFAFISIPLNMVLSYSLALVLLKDLKGMKVMRLLCYLPVLIPGIVIGQIWTDILGYPTGIINQWLTNMGMEKRMFFSAEDSQFRTFITISQWGIGGGMIMWIASFKNIPESLYESAKLDGANYMRMLFTITIPMSSPMIFYNLINSIIVAMQTFDSYAYLGRGINDATYFVAIRIYVTAFTERNFGLACAIAWLLFIVIALLTVLTFRMNKMVFYGDESF